MNIPNNPHHKTFLVGSVTLAVILIACCVLYWYRELFHANVPPASAMDPATSSPISAPTMTFNDAAEGYALALPEGWRVEEDAKTSIAAYPSADAPECKLSLSVFPAVADEGRAQWIAATIGADPTLAVKESSSGDVSVGGEPGVRWTGTIDGMPATLVYIFSSAHAYEVAPSPMNGDASSCDDDLDTFLGGIAFLPGIQ